MRIGGDIKLLRLETRGCEADKLSCLSAKRATPHNCVEQLRTKRLVPNGIAQDGAVLPSKMRYDRVGRVLCNGVRSFARGDLYRYGVPFRRSIQIIHVDEPESRAIGIGRKSKLLGHFKIAKCTRLGTKPAGILDVIGKNVALELFSLAVAKQYIQLRWRFNGRDNVFLRRTARVDRRMQREPVIRVRPECDHVPRFPDRPK